MNEGITEDQLQDAIAEACHAFTETLMERLGLEYDADGSVELVCFDGAGHRVRIGKHHEIDVQMSRLSELRALIAENDR